MDCPVCDGYGDIRDEVEDMDGNWDVVYSLCYRCGGTGEIALDMPLSAYYTENNEENSDFEENGGK